MRNILKEIGTVGLQENNNLSTHVPWQPVTIPTLPYSVLSKPNGFMFTHGSACGSLATTSIEGHSYVGDAYVFRQDGTMVDVDRYLGSITPTNSLSVLKVPNYQIPFHHLKPTDQIIGSLPVDMQKQILNIIRTQ